MGFAKLFKGRKNAYGVWIPSKKIKEGKAQGKPRTETKVLKPELYQKHLDGAQGLGIIPIMKETSTCWWGAIDIDDYTIDLEALEKQIADLPIIVCRTKSGGAHLYLFCKKPIPAKILRGKLLDIAIKLGYPNAEIFPKQDELSRPTDVGNWINLPYYDHSKTTRYAVKDGKALSLDEFLEYAEEKKATEKELAQIKVELKTEFKGAPPCLQVLANRKIIRGQRNSGLYNFAVYCRMKYPDDWKTQLENINRDYVSPPASSKTVQNIIKSHEKNENYFYQCKDQPIIDFCNKDTCITREFGIGGGDEAPSVTMDNLIQINSEIPVWYMNVDGIKLQFKTEELMDQGKFRRVCFEKILKLPARIGNPAWDKIIQERLDNCEIREAPADAGPKGQLLHLLKEYFIDLPHAELKEEIYLGKPWVNTKLNRYEFLSTPFLAFLKDQKFYDLEKNKIFAYIREDLKGGNTTIRINQKEKRVWWFPIFEDTPEDYKVPESEDTPF